MTLLRFFQSIFAPAAPKAAGVGPASSSGMTADTASPGPAPAFDASALRPILGAAPWSEEEAVVLGQFLGSPTGQALGNRMRLMIAQVCVAGCQAENNTTYAAAVGAGWVECWRKVLELSQRERFSQDAEFTRGPAVTGSTHNNTRAPGDAPSRESEEAKQLEELLARFSP